MTDAERVFAAVAAAAPAVREAARHGSEHLGEVNPTGEERRAADVAADEALLDALRDCPGVGRYYSEEREDGVDVGEGAVVAADPLDGSSNLAANTTVGTVVGVYDDPPPASGADLVAACAVLYGPGTTMTAATRDRATRCRVVDGERTATEPLSLPDDPVVAGVGGRRSAWPDPVTDAVDDHCASLKTRYGGCFVADVAQVLAHGGVFAYPPLRDAPEGKLRYLYEVAPMALVVEAAGGRAEGKEGRILDAEPSDLHDRTPVALGDPDVVARLGAAFGESN